MIDYIVYNTATGEILKTGKCPTDMMQAQAHEGETVMQGSASDLNNYIVDGVVTAKQAQQTTIDKTLISANGIDSILISNVPTNAKLTIKNTKTFALNESTISGNGEFKTVDAGQYEIKVEKFPYLIWREIVTAE